MPISLPTWGNRDKSRGSLRQLQHTCTSLDGVNSRRFTRFVSKVASFPWEIVGLVFSIGITKGSTGMSLLVAPALILHILSPPLQTLVDIHVRLGHRLPPITMKDMKQIMQEGLFNSMVAGFTTFSKSGFCSIGASLQPILWRGEVLVREYGISRQVSTTCSSSYILGIHGRIVLYYYTDKIRPQRKTVINGVIDKAGLVRQQPM
jgi:hypothetical protein